MSITGGPRFKALKQLKALGANLTEQQIADALAISVMSQAEAEAGTATTIRFVTAELVAQAIAALGAGSALDTTNFTNLLSSAEDTPQKAFDVLDDILSGAVSIGGALSVSGSATLTDTDAGSGVGPTLSLYRDSVSPTALDTIGEVYFRGEDSAGNNDVYASVQSRIIDPASTLEDGQIGLRTVVAGSLALGLIQRAGLFTLGATGGDKGADTFNTGEYYKNGNVLVEVFRSTNSAITADSAHTFVHGLSAEPDMVTVILQCTTADLNYSVGDRVIIRSGVDGGGISADQGITPVVDATNVVVYVAQEIHILDKSTFANSAITLGSWDMYVKAVLFG